MASDAEAESVQVRTEKADADCWNPVFLRKRVLLAFLVTYGGLIVAFCALMSYSSKHDGLGTVPRRNYLLWQYGPTAGLTLIATLWGRVVYRAKQLAPWQLMAQGPQPAECSVLLDLVSPFSPFVLLRSARTTGTRSVAVAIACSMIIQLVMVLSTGLFAMQTISMERQQHNPVVVGVYTDINPIEFHSHHSDHRPLARVFAVNSNNLPYPKGTTPDYAFEPIYFSLSSETTTLVNKRDVFHGEISCEPLSAQRVLATPWESGPNETSLYLDLTLHSETYGTINITAPKSLARGFFYNLDTAPVLERPDDKPHFVLSIGTTDTAFSSSLRPAAINVSSVLCHPDYGISPGTVVIDTTDKAGSTLSFSVPKVTIADEADSRKLLGLSPIDLVAIWDLSPNNMGLSLLPVLTAILGANASDLVTNANMLCTGAEQLYRSVAAQAANLYLLTQAEKPINGTRFVPESRLLVQKSTFGIIQGLLFCLLGLTALLMLLVPKASIPCNVGSIGGMLMVVAQCPDLIGCLRGTGHLDIAQVRYAVGMGRLWLTERPSAALEQEFGIVAESGLATDTPRLVEMRTRTPRWYIPPSIRLCFRTGLFAAILLVLGALDFLYHFGQAHDGIIDVELSDSYANYASTFVPAFVLASIGLMYAGFDFNVRLFQPYDILRRDDTRTSGRRVLFEDYLGKIRLHCLWSALRHGHIPTVASSLGMIAASFLPILVSGVFHTQPVQRTLEMQLWQNSSFGMDFRNLLQYDPYWSRGGGTLLDIYEQGTAIANLIALDGASEPGFTTGNLAFPHLAAIWPEPYNTRKDLRSGKTSARVPAVRAKANCTAIQTDWIYANSTYPVRAQNLEHSVGVCAIMKPGCSIHNPRPNPMSRPCPDFMSSDAHKSEYSMSLDVEVLPGMYFGSFSYLQTPDDAGCREQQYLAIVGQADADGKTANNLSMLTCLPYVESIIAEVTLEASDLSISRRHQPKPDESTTVLLDRVSAPLLATMMYRNFVLRPQTSDGSHFRLDNLSSTPSQAYVDGFFAYMLAGKQAPSPADIVGPVNQDRLVAAIDDAYGRTVAQVLNVWRLPPAPDQAVQRISATAVFDSRDRLVQSAVPTRILQCLLVLMLVCLLVVHFSLRVNKTLPKNPCSIAAVASLLVDADLLAVVPKGAEFMPQKDMEALLKHHRLSMGWWRDSKFGIGIGRAEQEDLAG